MRGDPPYGDLHNSTLRSPLRARGSTPPAPQPALCQIVHHRMREDPPCSSIQVLHCPLSTPHARGSTHDKQLYKNSLNVSRMRITRSWSKRWKVNVYPHARGSTQHQSLLTTPEVVYPACAGIHPVLYLSIALGSMSTPHARGSTQGQPLTRLIGWCLPRMRGDPPGSLGSWVPWRMSTPACAGIHPGDMLAMLTLGVYPACAGSTLDRLREDILGCLLPHARGSTATLGGKGGRKMVYLRMRGDPPARSWIKGSHKESTKTACAGIHRQNPLLPTV